jgi:hypothetical protein
MARGLSKACSRLSVGHSVGLRAVLMGPEGLVGSHWLTPTGVPGMAWSALDLLGLVLRRILGCLRVVQRVSDPFDRI